MYEKLSVTNALPTVPIIFRRAACQWEGFESDPEHVQPASGKALSRILSLYSERPQGQSVSGLFRASILGRCSCQCVRLGKPGRVATAAYKAAKIALIQQTRPPRLWRAER